VVEPTQLKNMPLKLDDFPRDRGEHKKIFETTTQVLHQMGEREESSTQCCAMLGSFWTVAW